MAKERHSKGERVPFSAWNQSETKLKPEATHSRSCFKFFLKKITVLRAKYYALDDNDRFFVNPMINSLYSLIKLSEPFFCWRLLKKRHPTLHYYACIFAMLCCNMHLASCQILFCMIKSSFWQLKIVCTCIMCKNKD